MNFITQTKVNWGKWVLNRKIRKIERKVRFFNFETAQTVGIIFDATHQEHYITAKKFINSLRKMNIHVSGLAYVPTKETLEYFQAHEGIKFFCIKHHNLLMKPKDKNIAEFCGHEFDILIDLTFDNLLQIKYIVGLSRAKLKLGRDMLHSNFYDFIIDIREHKLTFYIEQIIHYFTSIKAVRA